MIGHIIFRLVLWFLLTANFTLTNIIIGVIIAVVLPRSSTSPERLKDLLQGLGKIFIAIPQAYIEAVQMMVNPHKREEILLEQVQSGRSRGLIFLDIFLITFTPKTIVMNYHQDADREGWYEVHYVRPKPKKS